MGFGAEVPELRGDRLGAVGLAEWRGRDAGQFDLLGDDGFAAFAEPGGTGQDVFDLSAAGDYVVVCFIPVGSTPEAIAEAEASGVEVEGPPHFTQGMFQEFTVE